MHGKREKICQFMGTSKDDEINRLLIELKENTTTADVHQTINDADHRIAQLDTPRHEFWQQFHSRLDSDLARSHTAQPLISKHKTMAEAKHYIENEILSNQ